jgi:hypothetical protein
LYYLPNYNWDKISRLTQATIRGVFEDEFTKVDMNMGTADQDYAAWYKAPSDFVKTYMTNESAWFTYIDISARGIRGQSESQLEKIRMFLMR